MKDFKKFSVKKQTFNKNPIEKPTFKPKSKQNDEFGLKTTPFQIEDDVPDFPRGGASSLSRQELDEVRAEADAEFEGEKRGSKKNKKKTTQKRSHSADDDLGSLFGGGVSGKLPRFANKITWKNISPGMKLWGVVAEINEKDIVISLPGGLRGLVRAKESYDDISEITLKDLESNLLSSMYHVGQLVSCIVLQLDDDKKEKGKPKIWLSLRLSLLHKSLSLDVIQEGMVLSAYVKSIEDHGYILYFGHSSFAGFMQKSNQPEKREAGANTGKLLQGVVKSIDQTRKVVYLSSDPDVVSKSVTKELKGISIDLLVPGMMVNAHVNSTLENGILLSFLTYFTGSVDIFHLEKTFPSAKWKDEYLKNKKVNARILFIDPSTRAIGLTLNPHLVQNKAPPSLTKTGDIFDNSKVIRVDKGMGLLLEIPTTPIPTPAYVIVSDVADKEVKKLEKSFKEGSRVRARILGFKHLEGLATSTLKTSAFEGSVFTHSDVKPGMVVKAKVIVVDSLRAIVQFPSGVKALCPLRHMSEFEITKPRKKFQVGAELQFRVLGCKSKRITVTHKKTLLKSKLPIIGSYADATEGLITHGWITKIESHGCFVHFYNGVRGFAPRSELGLEPGGDPSSVFHIEEVVKCRITSSAATSRRINLSFLMSPSRITAETVKLGSIVSGIVEQVTPHAVIVRVDNTVGSIPSEHLADHQVSASTLKSLLKPGFTFDQLLVLDTESRRLTLTAKHSLVNSVQKLPSEASQIKPGTVVHGYVCNLIETGCFVRYLGRLTAFVPRSKAMDDRRANFPDAFYIGQSVRSHILEVCKESGRVTSSLKQSLCTSTDAAFVQDYFLMEDKIARLQLSDAKNSDLDWVENFSFGKSIEGKVSEVKEFGVVINFEKHPDVVGFVTHYHLGGAAVKTGSTVQAVVLDAVKTERLVDLSLKKEFTDKIKENTSDVEGKKKKRKRAECKELEVNRTVNAIVEIVKDHYLVLSIPEYNFAIGCASVNDYNTQKFPPRQYVNGQSVTATVMALPSPATAGRLLLLLKNISEASETSSSKRAKKKSAYDIGAIVQTEITEIKPLELKVKFGSGLHGRVHITEAKDSDDIEDPFKGFRVGQTQTAIIVSKLNKFKNNQKNSQFELSIKPTLLNTPAVSIDKITAESFDFSIGQYVTGFVYKVDKEWLWLAVSRHVKAQLYFLDTECEPSKLKNFQQQYSIGNKISGYVLSINKEKKMLRLVLKPLKTQATDVDNTSRVTNAALHINEGDILGGRIWKILPGVGGMLIQLDPHLYGKVHYTEVTDLFDSNPLSGFSEGQFVKCKVLEISNSVQGTFHVDLSLRDSKLMSDVSSLKRVENIEDLQPNMSVKGYVKNVMAKGCFIMLSRKLDAKILLSHLSDSYTENPEKEFPVGKLVVGKVVKFEVLSKRVEVTLKTENSGNSRKSSADGLNSLSVGNMIIGRIKRIELYGLFITIGQTNLVGLCHVSELSDDQVVNIETKYKVGERVKAKVLKVDEERHRISLGMKESYMTDNYETQSPLIQEQDDFIHENDDKEEESPDTINDIDIEYENGELPILEDVKARACILPLDVSFDDIEDSVMVDVSGKKELTDDAEIVEDKNNRRGKKKAKEEREQEIRAAEERLLEKDTPRNADEFEKLVRTSPNSSFVWIKYMAFMLSLVDIDSARKIAERALQTINIREEAEKLNVWVAYFNLENEFGSPREEAVLKIFHRALQVCDPKKVQLALLGMYERTEQHRLTEELLNKMSKKFKHSCKVWLRRFQWLLKQNKDDDIQSMVKRAVLCLPRHKHIKFLSQAAILEFKCGVADRGRSMFEGMLREYPKRTDLWNMYLDQEIRVSDNEVTRALFERATSLSLPRKKMMFLFKKYLEYEKSLGEEERIEYVKKKAMEYAELLA